MKKFHSLFSSIAVLLCTSVLITGCGSKTTVFNNYELYAPEGASSALELYTQKYLSEGICVVPAGSKSTDEEAAAVMTADASLIFNNSTGEWLYANNIYNRMYPASTTKIVTALVALKYGNLDDVVTVSYNASHITEYGAKLCGFAEGDRIRLKKLLYSFLICSGNDAGIAIAEHIAGSVDAFANMMNTEMKELGAVGTHFVNPHGLHDDNHYTTPYDLYLAFHELLQYDVFLDIINQPSYTAKFKGADGTQKQLYFLSTDRYLLGTATAPDRVTVIGGKTGTTAMAGSNLILYSKDNSGNDYISVVMHASDAESLYYQMNYLMDMEINDEEITTDQN